MMAPPLSSADDDVEPGHLPMGMSIPGFTPADVAYVSAADNSTDFVQRMNETMGRLRRERGIGNEAAGKTASDDYVDNLRRYSAAAPDALALADAAVTAASPTEAIDLQRGFDNAGENYMRDLATAAAVARAGRSEEGGVADTRELLSELNKETAERMTAARGEAGGRGLDAAPLPPGWRDRVAAGVDDADTGAPAGVPPPAAAAGGGGDPSAVADELFAEESPAEAEDAIEASVRAMRAKLGVPDDEDDVDGAGEVYPQGEVPVHGPLGGGGAPAPSAAAAAPRGRRTPPPRAWEEEPPPAARGGAPPPVAAADRQAPPAAPAPTAPAAEAGAAAAAAAAEPASPPLVGEGDDEAALTSKIDFFEAYLRRLERSSDAPEQRAAAAASAPPPVAVDRHGGGGEPALGLAAVMREEDAAVVAAAAAATEAPPVVDPTTPDAVADAQLAVAQAELDALLAAVTPPEVPAAPAAAVVAVTEEATPPAPPAAAAAAPAAAAPPAPAPTAAVPALVPTGGASDAMVAAALGEVAAEMKRYKKVLKAARKEHQARVENIVRGMAASAEGAD